MKRNYLKRQKDLRNEKPLVVTVVEGSHLGDGGDVFPATVESPRKSDWILNSDYSFHISSAKEHFDMSQPYAIGNVNMANGT